MEVPKHSASCQVGYRHEIDPYNITGIAGPNFDNYVKSGWYPIIAIQVLPVGASSYERVSMCILSTRVRSDLWTRGKLLIS
jgi:hypothetical protein